MGGWSLSAHHAYDPIQRQVYLGTGERQAAQVVEDVVTSAAGRPFCVGDPPACIFSLGDGGPASEARLKMPTGVAVAPDGSLLIADSRNDRIRRVAPDQRIFTIAGAADPFHTGPNDGDGGPAFYARLHFPVGVAVGPDGAIYVADFGHHRVRRIDPLRFRDGGSLADDVLITTVAGTGVAGFSGDGGPASAAQIENPSAVAVAADGTLFIADSGNVRIRAVSTDGTIRTVAGTGVAGFSGDGGPAVNAQIATAAGIAAGPDGSLYLADAFNFRVRRVAPDGVMHTLAGNGLSGYTGDGGPATAARLGRPEGVAAGADGTVYIADEGMNLVRAVRTDGTITTVAGDGQFGSQAIPDFTPARAARLEEALGVAVAPDGALYVGGEASVSYDDGRFPDDDRVRRVGPAFPGFSGGEIAVASESGREVYVFDARGKHLRTLDAWTGAVRYAFTYDARGLLSAVQDVDGLVTAVERDAAGMPAAIVAPGGQRTALTVDANGYLASVANPAGETTQLVHTANGLLSSLTTPKLQVHSFQYDALGRLTRDEDPAGGFYALSRQAGSAGYTATLETALGRTTTYQVERPGTGTRRRVNTGPDGLAFVSEDSPAGVRTVQSPDGMLTTVTQRPDPRFGMMAPLLSSATAATPGGRIRTMTTARAFQALDAFDASRFLQTDTVAVNGRVFVSAYDSTTRVMTDTTAAGRVVTTALDAAGRVVRSEVAGLEPVVRTYDARGRLLEVAQGAGASARTTTFAYDARDRLAAVTDPLLRTVEFEYDLADRVVRQWLPGGRSVGYSYDANGNLSSLSPPGRPAHLFDYTPVDLESAYTPPDLGIGPTATVYDYSEDRQVVLVTRPDGQTLGYAYDSAGRLGGIDLLPCGEHLDFTYSAATGKLSILAGPADETLSYAYDGTLVSSEALTGTVAGTVSQTYDHDFRVATQSVNGGSTVSFGYDADGLLASAGDLTLTRHAQTGLVTATSLGGVSDLRGYNSLGEVTSYSAGYSGSTLYQTSYVRDQIGRIVEKTEMMLGVTTTDAYEYDAAGRLWRVRKDGVLVREYTYDANGNRLTETPGGPIIASYDAQDRLLSYGGTTYSYTANGELTSKTDAAGTTTYGYDAMGNLREVTLPDGRHIEYVVDGRGRRVGKKVDGTLVQAFLYDGQFRIVAELDGSGVMVSRFVYGMRVNVPEYMVRGGRIYRFLTDHLGSPHVVVDVLTGVEAQHLRFDEWGQTISDTNMGWQPFGFAGGTNDESGLVHFGKRDYDPLSGRWTTSDPVRFSGGDANLYGYVVSDPINAVDPSGLSVGDWWDPRTYYEYWKQFGGGTSDFLKNYFEIRDLSQWERIPPGRDKFFHCMANCMASNRGPGGDDAARVISELREQLDEATGTPVLDCDADRIANADGRRGGDCMKRCGPWIFLPRF